MRISKDPDAAVLDRAALPNVVPTTVVMNAAPAIVIRAVATEVVRRKDVVLMDRSAVPAVMIAESQNWKGESPIYSAK